MGYEVRVTNNGEDAGVVELDIDPIKVTRVSVMTRRGEAAAKLSPANEEFVTIAIETRTSSDVPNLSEVEDAKATELREAREEAGAEVPAREPEPEPEPEEEEEPASL